jgi:GMP synthase-like glutamine amidotransferase
MPEAAKLRFLVSGESRGDLGQIDAVLAEAKRSFVFVDRWEETDVTYSPSDFAGLIILGDSNQYSAPSKKFWRDREWLAAAMGNNKPVLGICYGAQLMVAQLAGLKRKIPGLLVEMPKKDHAGKIVTLEFRGEGLTDPVMEPLRRSPFAIMAHVDCFQQPPGGFGLAWSTSPATEHCEAFRVGRPEDAVYGLQFHPEPDLSALQTGWFKEKPDAGRLQAAVTTGREVLTAWVERAIAR